MWKLLPVVLSFLISVNQAKVPCGVFSSFEFPCRNGGCTSRTFVCDMDDDCGDRSDETVCGPDCPKFSYQCADKSGCYNHSNYCDGKHDCDDSSDEKDCWAMKCGKEQTRCLDGLCAASRDNCCATLEGICVRSHFDTPRETMNKTLVYADGGNLYHLSLANNSRRRLHRQDANVLALTYNVGTNMLYWIEKENIWNMTLTATIGKAQLFGRLQPECIATAMAHDWITGNFYIACTHSGLIACHSQVDTMRITMLCSSPIHVAFGGINWLTLDPSHGRMFVGSIHRERIQIAEAETDGSNPKKIYEEKTDRLSQPSWNKDDNEISVLSTAGRGALFSVNLLDAIEKRVTHNIVGYDTDALALNHDVAIMRQSGEIYALFFWNGRTVVTQKKLDVGNWNGPLTLIDTNAPPMSENRCDSLNCDHLCLPVPDGAVCACSAGYRLMDDGQTCALRQRKTEADRSCLLSGMSTLNQLMAIAAVVVSVSCIAVFFFLFSRRNSNMAQSVRPETTTSVNRLYGVYEL